MGKEKVFDRSDILDNLSGVHRVGIYDPDANKTGTGVGSNQKEAYDNARVDLEAQKIAEKAQDYIKEKK